MRRSITVLLLLLTSPAAADTVGAGALRAEVTGEPFALAFAQQNGPTLTVRELGFDSARATGGTLRRDGAALTGELQTDDPLGRTISVRIEPAGPGSIRLTATATGASAVRIAFATVGNERFYGFGERSHLVEGSGSEIESYVSDGPYVERDRPFIKAATPPWAARDRNDSTYYPVPWLLSSRGYGALVEGAATSVFDLAGSASWSARAEGAQLAVRVFAGPSMAAALRRFTAATGRQP
ncbi:MAG: hypothetical protein ABIO51_02035, partial [Solirubrobacteraceae bacterium]